MHIMFANSFVARKLGTPPPHYNTLDGKVDRRSHMGPYDVIDGIPRCVYCGPARYFGSTFPLNGSTFPLKFDHHLLKQ